MDKIKSDYLFKGFDHDFVVEIVQAAKHALRDVVFDAIAFTGISGALIAPVVAYEMGKDLIVVRKEKPYQGHHSGFRVEGRQRCRYVFLDDFVYMGETRARVEEQIDRHLPGCHRVGVYLWRDDEWHPDEVRPATVVLGTPYPDFANILEVGKIPIGVDQNGIVWQGNV